MAAVVVASWDGMRKKINSSLSEQTIFTTVSDELALDNDRLLQFPRARCPQTAKLELKLAKASSEKHYKITPPLRVGPESREGERERNWPRVTCTR